VNRPGVVTRFPAEQQTDSLYRTQLVLRVRWRRLSVRHAANRILIGSAST